MAEAGPLIDKDFLKDHFLEVYLEDAIAQMLANRQEGNKSPIMKPCKFFKEYFTSVHQGTHILFREFSFVSATPYNRLCVMKAIMQIFKPLLYIDDGRRAREYHTLLQLVWPDFRMQVVQDAFAAYNDDKKDKENCVKFLDFIKAMKMTFCTGPLDYEADIIEAQIDAKIGEFSKIPVQIGGGSDAPTNLSEADFLVNVEDDTGKPSPWAFASKILDGTEFKRILNIDSNSVSSDEPEPVSETSLSNREPSIKGGKKKGKGIAKKGNTTKSKSRGRLAGKHLSNSLNILEKSGKTEADKPKRRHRSKSAVATQRNQIKKPWRPYVHHQSLALFILYLQFNALFPVEAC